MRNIRNINRQSVESLVRDGFLPPGVLTERGSEDHLLLEQMNEIGANRLWVWQGTIYIAIAVQLSNRGDNDRTVDDCCCEFEWATHVELLKGSEEDYTHVFVAGGEEFARSTVLNSRILGSRLPKCGGALEGILLFKVYGLPTQRQVAPKMKSRLKVVFSNGLEIEAPATMRVQGIEELLRTLPLQPAAVLPIAEVTVPVMRNRRPLFDAGKEP